MRAATHTQTWREKELLHVTDWNKHFFSVCAPFLMVHSDNRHTVKLQTQRMMAGAGRKRQTSAAERRRGRLVSNNVCVGWLLIQHDDKVTKQGQIDVLG